MFFSIDVLFNILTLCNNASNSVRVCFCGLFQYDSRFNTVFQKPRSQTLHMVPDLGKQGPRPCFGHFFQVSYLLILISADIPNASIMPKIVFLNILKPYFMTLFHFFTIKKN